jgi:hypothetical protein
VREAEDDDAAVVVRELPEDVAGPEPAADDQQKGFAQRPVRPGEAPVRKPVRPLGPASASVPPSSVHPASTTGPPPAVPRTWARATD